MTTTETRPAADGTDAERRRPGPARSGGDIAVSVTSHLTLVLWSLLVIVPLLWVLLSSFKTTNEIFASPFGLPAHWSFDNFVSAWSGESFGRYFLNTIVVVGAALVIVMLLGALLAYAIARYTFPGRRIIYVLMLVGLSFPVFLAIVPLFFVLQNLGLLRTLPGLILVYVAFALPFTVFFLYAFFRSLPYEISEAAEVDGAGDWRLFFSIMLPMAKPGLAAVATFNFLGLWNQFLLPTALNSNRENYVLSQGLALYASSAGYAVDFGSLFAAVVITVVPVLVVYVIFQRPLQGSVSSGTLK